MRRTPLTITPRRNQHATVLLDWTGLDWIYRETVSLVNFKLCMTVYKCLHGLAPKYLAELCVPVADVAGRRQLRSASRGHLNFPRYNMSNYVRRAFCFAGPYVRNSLPEHIRQSVFKQSVFLSC